MPRLWMDGRILPILQWARSQTPADVMDIFVLENGTASGTTTDYRDGNLSLVDDGSLNTINNFDRGNYSIEMDSSYLGPPSIILVKWENSQGYVPHPVLAVG